MFHVQNKLSNTATAVFFYTILTSALHNRNIGIPFLLCPRLRICSLCSFKGDCMLFNPLMGFFAPGLAFVPPSAPPVKEKPALFPREVLQTAQRTFIHSQIAFQTNAYLVAHKAMCDAMFMPLRFWAPVLRVQNKE